MKKRHALMAMALLAATALPAAAHAQVLDCRPYTRTVTFADGTQRQAQGTACLAADGVWRVTQESLTPLSAPLPPQVYYAPPVYYPVSPQVYYAPPPVPAYYPYYPTLYNPWAPSYYGTSVSFGVVYRGHDHDHDHYDHDHDHGHYDRDHHH